MTAEKALEKRQQMLDDGFCVIEDIVTEEFLEEMRDETERLIANHEEPPDMVYQGQHIGVRREGNAVLINCFLGSVLPSPGGIGLWRFPGYWRHYHSHQRPQGSSAILAPGLDAMGRSKSFPEPITNV